MQNRAPGTLRDAWTTRPVRPRENRMIAGVAAGIARRYGVDPVLVRVGFAVTAFYGPGLPLYLLGCALLPDGGRAGRGRAGTVVSAVLVVAAAVVTTGFLAGTRGTWLVPLLFTLGLLVLLHVTRRHMGTVGAGAPSGAVPVAAATGAGTAGTPVAAVLSGPAVSGRPVPGVPVSDPPGSGVPESGVQAGEAGEAATVRTAVAAPAGTTDASGDARPDPGDPGATDVVRTDGVPGEPEPGADGPPGPAPRARSRVTPVTLALAVLAAGGQGVATLIVPGALGPIAVPATALGVVGIGLVVGAFRHSGRWLVPFALVLGVVTWAIAVVPAPDLTGGVGTVTDRPTSVAAVQPEYRRGIGDVALDLSGLDLRAVPGAPAPAVRTSARVGIGSVAVVVPPDADLVIRGDAGFGDVSVPGQTRTGGDARLTVVDNGPDGPGGGRIELDLHATVGSVAVSRG